MRALADENVPRSAVESLRSAGHDVAWIRQDAAGSADDAVFKRAQQEDRVLLTFDKDFGELAFRAARTAASGIILFRLGATNAQDLARRVVAATVSRSEWRGLFAVVTNAAIRIRPLPGSGPEFLG